MSTFGRISIFNSSIPGWKTSRREPVWLKQPKTPTPGTISLLPKVDFDHALAIDKDYVLNLMAATHNCLKNFQGPIEFGSFLLMKKLGEGGYGVTFKAIDMRDGKARVVKVPLRFEELNFQALREEGQKSLVSGSLDGEVITVKEMGDVNGIPYISMRLIDGHNLFEVMLLNGGSLPLKRSLETMIGLCESAEHYHALGVIHRDIKPENIMIGNDTKVVLIDPGLCAVESEANGFAGTPKYASPEQARGDQLSPRSEVFTLGVILFEILTGNHPFESYTLTDLLNKIQNKEPDFSLLPQKTREQKQLLYLLKRALAKDPKCRTSSVAGLRGHLEIILKNLP